jgi:hypothetical protein
VGAFHGVDRTCEVSDDAVTRGVEDAAPVNGDQTVDDGAARLEPRERADLIAPEAEDGPAAIKLALSMMKSRRFIGVSPESPC